MSIDSIIRASVSTIADILPLLVTNGQLNKPQCTQLEQTINTLFQTIVQEKEEQNKTVQSYASSLIRIRQLAQRMSALDATPLIEECDKADKEQAALAREAQLKRLQGIAMDSLKNIFAIANIPTDEPQQKLAFLGHSIQMDNPEGLESIVKDAGTVNALRSSTPGWDYELSLAINRPTKLSNGLGTIALMGSHKVMRWMLQHQLANPNYFVEFPDPRLPIDCVCGDNVCKQSSTLPPWVSAAAAPLPPEVKSKGLTILLKYGADPLLKTSEGKFWLTHVVCNTFDPDILHHLLSAVTDMSQSSRIDLTGRRVSLIDDVLAESERLLPHITPLATETNDILTAAGFGGQIFHVLGGALNPEDTAAVQWWQKRLCTNVSVMIGHGIACADETANKVEALLHFKNYNNDIDSRNPLVVRPTTVLQKRAMHISEIGSMLKPAADLSGAAAAAAQAHAPDLHSIRCASIVMEYLQRDFAESVFAIVTAAEAAAQAAAKAAAAQAAADAAAPAPAAAAAPAPAPAPAAAENEPL